MQVELKPCAHCGDTRVPHHRNNGIGDAWLECFGCGCGTGLHESIESAIAAWNRRATDGQCDTARGVPTGWKLAPIEATPEIMAGAALAVLRPASKVDLDLAQAAARIVLERATAVPPGLTADMLAASIATMAPAYRAMLAATPTPPDGDAERERADAFVREFQEWVKQTGALPWGGSWMAEVSSIIERASLAAQKKGA